ncbi:MAG: hypothetical protein M1829_000177 [Trizodia sp. TS-e1964]|nr:MAG: hypothetical protein M1829_000177 [Trizodia sp. TS-e1964]
MSALERLPTEILGGIFLSSLNCDLPLTSTSLLATLSRASLPRDMLVSVLLSSETPSMSALLRRRFFNCYLLHEADEQIVEMGGPDRPALFNKDVELCERLLNNFGGNFGVGFGFWSRALSMFQLWDPPNMGKASIASAAQRGCHELVLTGNLQEALELLEPAFANHCINNHWFELSPSTVNSAVTRDDCQDFDELDFDLIHAIFRHWVPQADEEIEAWLKKRISSDRLAREGPEYQECKENFVQSDENWELSTHWMGEWIALLYFSGLNGPRFYNYYLSFYCLKLAQDCRGVNDTMGASPGRVQAMDATQMVTQLQASHLDPLATHERKTERASPDFGRLGAHARRAALREPYLRQSWAEISALFRLLRWSQCPPGTTANPPR